MTWVRMELTESEDNSSFFFLGHVRIVYSAEKFWKKIFIRSNFAA